MLTPLPPRDVESMVFIERMDERDGGQIPGSFLPAGAVPTNRLASKPRV